MMRGVLASVAAVAVLLGACDRTTVPAAFAGERVVDTTTAPAPVAGYQTTVEAVDWLLLDRKERSLEVVVAGGGCSNFNGVTVRQTATRVEVSVLNTVHSPVGLAHVCHLNFLATKREVVLPEPLRDAVIVGGCPANETGSEGQHCRLLRSASHRF
jgi:hypothetical protein